MFKKDPTYRDCAIVPYEPPPPLPDQAVFENYCLIKRSYWIFGKSVISRYIGLDIFGERGSWKLTTKKLSPITENYRTPTIAPPTKVIEAMIRLLNKK